jgi:hypothetical protein
MLVDKSDLAKCMCWAVREDYVRGTGKQRIVPRVERRRTI